MDFNTLTIDLLKLLASLVGSWGVAIILLTIIVRALMWPSNVSQQRSMRTMQTLQPKMKAIQDRYKNDPETMQRKMMEFYKENKFNPMAGCLPLLLQLPVFILLYGALMSPQFIEQAGNTHFLFINRLDATIKSNAGVSNDGTLSMSKDTKLSTGKTIKVYLKNGQEIDKVKIQKPLDTVTVRGEETPGENINLVISLNSLDLKYTEFEGLQKADVDIINSQTRETEKVTFSRDGNVLSAAVPTVEVKNIIHYDVIFLVLLFALTMWISQKVMMASQKNAPQDPTQAAIQKSMGTMMPVMICVTFVMIPIPAGVLLYLVTSNIFQIIQTKIINKQLEKEDEAKKSGSQDKPDVEVKGAKTIKAKEIRDTQA